MSNEEQNGFFAKPVLGEGLIKVEISRVLCDYGWKPFVLTCRTHKIKRAYDKYGTLKELKTYYNIEKLQKTKKKEWAISSRGTRHEWFVYEAYVSAEYVI
jgi:hypothetical protein